MPVGGAGRAKIRDSARAVEVLQTSIAVGQHVLPVVNVEGKLVGLLTRDELAALEAEPSLSLLVTASDIMRPPACVRRDETLLAAFDTMRSEALPELPVLGADGKVVGFIDEATIASAYLHESDPKSRRAPGGGK